MASTPFVPTSWGEEPITTDKLQVMSSNDQWLFENTPKISFSNMGVTKASGSKILTGGTYVPPNNKISVRSTAYFGTYFSPGCRPIVVASVFAYPQMRIACSIAGIGSIACPDHRGCVFYIWAGDFNPKYAILKHAVRISWIAMGF